MLIAHESKIRELLEWTRKHQVLRMSRRHPLSFDEEAARAGVISRVPAGVQPIRVRRIVGSAGKAEAIGPDFLPLGRGPAAAHFRDILRVMDQGEELPPISVYQLGYRYFVIDGHTRVAATKALGIEFLDAEVTEALPRRDGAAYLTYHARREFEQKTGLQGIRLTAPWRYHLLQRHVDGYRLYIEHSWSREVSLRVAAGIWQRTQYEPTLLEISRRQLPSSSGGCTVGDVYTDILKAWANDDSPGTSLRERLERYDQSHRQELSRLTRARRLVSSVVDASLPKGIPSINRARAAAFVAHDVEADLACVKSDGHVMSRLRPQPQRAGNCQ